MKTLIKIEDMLACRNTNNEMFKYIDFFNIVMFEKELKELGMTDNEVKIYLTLLKYGQLNPTSLATKTGLHRSYVYDTLERLLEKGNINTVLINNKKHFQAINPKILREQFEIKLKQLDDILPTLNSLFKIKKETTNVELHKGDRVYRTVLKNLMSTVKKGDSVYIVGIDENALEELEPIYLKQYLNIIKGKGVKEKIVISKGKKKYTEHKHLEYKELNKKYIGDTLFLMHNDKVFLFIAGIPNYLIIITNPKVADSYKNMFQLLWNNAK